MKPATIEYSDIEKQFEFVDTLINKHLDRAVQNINTEMLYTYWEVGQYISERLKSSAWGEKVVTDLADYLKRRNPKRRGYSKRNLYNMIGFYAVHSVWFHFGVYVFVEVPKRCKFTIGTHQGFP